MVDGGGIGGCNNKLAPRLLEQIMTGLWSFVSLNQVFAASIELAHDDAPMYWLVYSGEMKQIAITLEASYAHYSGARGIFYSQNTPKVAFELKINSQVNFNAEFSAVQHRCASGAGAS